MIIGLVSEIVRSEMDKKEATSQIRQVAGQQIVPEERAYFVEVIETELMGLHEGNIARYRLRLSEYEQWKQQWR